MDALRSGAPATPCTFSLLQRGLVVVQAALALVLLVGAELFSQRLNKLQSIDLKLQSNTRYIVHINPQAQATRKGRWAVSIAQLSSAFTQCGALSIWASAEAGERYGAD